MSEATTIGWILPSIGLSDAEWEIMDALLPTERGRGCRPAQDNSRYFESIMWIARTGAQCAAARRV